MSVPLASLLANVQRLPISTRRKLVERLDRFTPPKDWREDAEFYEWLAQHYLDFGPRHVDEALRAMGGNNAGRTLFECSIQWAKENGLKLRPGIDLDLQIKALDHDALFTRDLKRILALVTADEKPQVPEDGDLGPLKHARGDDVDRASAISQAEAALRRVDPLSATADLLQFIRNFAENLNERLETLEAERIREIQAAKVKAAIDALNEAAARLPSEFALPVAEIAISADVEAVEKTTEAVERLLVALATEAEASTRANASRLQDRLAARKHLVAATEAVETALNEAQEKLAVLLAPEQSKLPSETPEPTVEDLTSEHAPETLVDLSASPQNAADLQVETPADEAMCGSDETSKSPLPEKSDVLEGAGAHDITSVDEPVAVMVGEPNLPPEPPGSADPLPVAPNFEPVVTAPSEAATPAATPERAIDWDHWVDMALSEDRLGLAVHLSRARELAGADIRHSWPSVLLEGLIFGMSVEAANDRSSGRFEELSPQLTEIASSIDASTSKGFGQALGLIGCALRPCLVANYAGIHVLEELERGKELTAFHDLLELLREGPRLGLNAISEMAAPAEESDLEAQRQNVLEQLSGWVSAKQTRNMTYQPANTLWQRMIRADGVIGKVFEAAIARAPSAAEDVRTLVETLRNDREDFLDTHFREHMRGKVKELEGASRKSFLNLLDEARDHLEAWHRLVAPARIGDDRFERVRPQFLSALSRALVAIAELVANGDRHVRLGAALLQRVLEPFLEQISGATFSAPDPRVRLDTEIALLPEFPLNGRTGFEVTLDDVVAIQTSATVSMQERVRDWPDAFERALEVNAPGTAKRIMPLLPEPLREEAMLQIDTVVVRLRQELEQRRRALRAQLDDYLSATSGDAATEYEAHLQNLESFDLRTLPCEGQDEAGAIGDFPVLSAALELFARQLEGSRAQSAAALKQRIEAFEIEHTVDLADCRSLLAHGNLGTLSEELSQIERFGPDRPRADPQSVLEPLAHFSRHILTQFPDAPEVQFQSLREGALRGEARGQFRFDLLPEPERSDARALLDSWAQLKRTVGGVGSEASARKQALISFFSALGFINVRIGSETRWREGRRFDIKVDPVRSAGDCIIPAFGSQAEGAYTVLLMPRSGLEKSLPSGFNELQPPIIVLAMEWLSPKARREFLRKSRGRPGAFALLDDPGAAALAATPERSLRTFFGYAVPFGAARPYSDNSAATSVEMFFGRDREYGALVDPQGSCMVYGGRQLGKTALLKQIELRNSSNPDFLVVYRDIKNVGSVDLPSAIWDRIGEALKDKKFAANEACRGDRIVETMKGWLRVQPKRQLLILLDEADNFLESEMESDFEQIVKMKSLMEETGRRIKFVYAGLHNVQRFVRAPNSPFLHLGEPVNIGPLLGDDRHAARQMVLEPMAAVGVGFKETTDAHHMLSLVGYYPSLLQTFGKSLLKKVDEELARKGELEMPVLLDRTAIEEGFKASDFRDNIREKFRATLALDQRYELIAYAVCYKADEERARGQIAGQGYSNREIFDLAQEYWPQGFSDIRSSENFGVILDEMVGLGVLAHHREGYGIRSARIAAMLGDPDQIMTHLVEFSNRPRPTKPDPMANHRELANGGYSPMSWRSEKALIDQLRAKKHPVSIVFLAGSTAVGDTEDLVMSLTSLAEMHAWPPVRVLNYRNVEDLKRVIQSGHKEAQPGKPKLVICQGRWPTPDEVAGLDDIKELRDPQHPVRVAFVGAARDQAFGRSSAKTSRTLKSTLIDLTPWDEQAVQLWLLRHAKQGAEDPAFVSRVLEVTGGFSLVFDRAKLPKGPSPLPEEVLERLAKSAEANLNIATVGIDELPLRALAERLLDYDEPRGLTDQDIAMIAEELQGGPAALDALSSMGLLVQVQAKGEPHWRLLGKLRDILAQAL